MDPREPRSSTRIWHSTRTAAEYIDDETVATTVLRKCESGELHGYQRTPKGRWRIHVDCLDAWIRGEKCEHQRTARKTA